MRSNWYKRPFFQFRGIYHRICFYIRFYWLTYCCQMILDWMMIRCFRVWSIMYCGLWFDSFKLWYFMLCLVFWDALRRFGTYGCLWAWNNLSLSESWLIAKSLLSIGFEDILSIQLFRTLPGSSGFSKTGSADVSWEDGYELQDRLEWALVNPVPAVCKCKMLHLWENHKMI